MSGNTLVINCGSSSIKFAVMAHSKPREAPLIHGTIEGIGLEPEFSAVDVDGRRLRDAGFAKTATDANHHELTIKLLEWLWGQEQCKNLAGVGHRVVHGGRHYDKPVLVNTDVLIALEKLSSLAPQHQPHNLSAIRTIAGLAPDLPQVACFDTSFHRTQPRVAQLFAIPRALSDSGIIRYGFHGLSYDYITSRLPDYLGDRADGRVLVAHLGNGASMCAIRARHSVATSMGFTALDGLMMGRRCGSIDPGVILHLLQSEGMSTEAIEHMLYFESGLLGVSGISNNMRTLSESSDPNANEAIELFCYRAALELGAMTVALQGLDAIVFTAGIGENSPMVRERICAHLHWLGVRLDEDANARNRNTISAVGTGVEVLVIPTNEEAVIANAVQELLF